MVITFFSHTLQLALSHEVSDEVTYIIKNNSKFFIKECSLSCQ
ncbi:hypothetical protein DOY81_004105, partial [Sarcophaga bullata]